MKGTNIRNNYIKNIIIQSISIKDINAKVDKEADIKSSKIGVACAKNVENIYIKNISLVKYSKIHL